MENSAGHSFNEQKQSREWIILENVLTLGTDQLTHISGESSTSGGHGLFNKFRIQTELKSVQQLADTTLHLTSKNADLYVVF